MDNRKQPLQFAVQFPQLTPSAVGLNFMFNYSNNSTLPFFEISKNKGNSQIRSRIVAEIYAVLWVFMGFHGGLVRL